VGATWGISGDVSHIYIYIYIYILCSSAGTLTMIA
jgi:hypothetical protein